MFFPAIFTLAFFCSCSNSSNNKENGYVKNNPDSSDQKNKKQLFFPVTAYFKGQLYEIAKDGINPLKYVTINNHTDSAWLKIEDLPRVLNEFLTPEIDSLNLVSLFKENNFMDQTLNVITLTYEPAGPLPDSMKLRHWDVYIDPNSGKVKRIYIVKISGENKLLQLTWVGDKWCKITTIFTNPDGSSVIEKEEKINWDF